MAADAVVQEEVAVAARRAAHVLPDAVGPGGHVAEVLHVHAQHIEGRETHRRAVGTCDEERLCEAARRHDAGRVARSEHTAGHGSTASRARGSRSGTDRLAESLQVEVVGVVGLRIRDARRGARAGVDDVVVHHLIERHVVANHADHRRGRVVEIRVHGAVAVRPRRCELAHGRVVELRVRHRLHRGADRVTGGDFRLHRVEHRRARRRADEPVMQPLRLLTWAGATPRRRCDAQRGRCRVRDPRDPSLDWAHPWHLVDPSSNSAPRAPLAREGADNRCHEALGRRRDEQSAAARDSETPPTVQACESRSPDDSLVDNRKLPASSIASFFERLECECAS